MRKERKSKPSKRAIAIERAHTRGYREGNRIGWERGLRGGREILLREIHDQLGISEALQKVRNGVD